MEFNANIGAFIKFIYSEKATKYCNNIVGVTRVHWRIYSRGVVQYIQRREAPRDILLNPEGVYSPIYPCHAHYITIVIGKNKSAIALVILKPF